MEMVSNRQASFAFFGGIGAAIAVAAICLLCGCKTYYENAGMRVRAGSVTAPVEVSEPTSSVNVRLFFFLDGVDLYAAKGYTVEMDYAKANGGTWLSPAVTQDVHVVVRPITTNGVNQVRK